MARKLLTVALCALLAGVSFGQEAAQDPQKEKPAPGQDPAQKAGEPTKTNLFLLARVGTNDKGESLSEKILLENFTSGLKETKSQYSEPIKIRAISPAVFRDIRRLVGGSDEEPWKISLKNGAILSQSNIGDSTFLYLELPTNMLAEKMDLKVAGSPSLSGTYSPKGEEGGSRKMTLVNTSPPTYSILWALNAQITEVNLETVNKESPSEIKTEKFEIGTLKADKYFSVTINNFEGDKKKLFERLKSPAKYEDVIRIGADFSEYTVQMATMGLGGGGGGSEIDGKNQWVPSITQNSNGTTSKVWILFPLTGEQAAAEAAKINAAETVGEAYKLVNQIEGKIDASKTVEVNPGKPAQWIELAKVPDPVTGTKFTRPIPLKNMPDLLKEFPSFYMVVVRERTYDDTDRVEIIRAPKLANVVEVNGLNSAIKKAIEAKVEPEKDK